MSTRRYSKRQASAPLVPEARRAALPEFVDPSLALLSDKPPSGPEWVHEINLMAIGLKRT